MARVNKRITQKTPSKPHAQVSLRVRAWMKACMKWLRLLVIAVASISVLSVAGFYSVNIAKDFLNRPIAEVIVEGEFHYVDKGNVNILVQQMIGSSFVGENIDVIKARLQAMPWIDNVNLARQWPDRLVIDVREQSPIARWGEDSFINIRGELINIVDNSELHHLSKLSGEKKSAPAIMQQYSILTHVFQKYDMSVSSLEKNRRGVWQLRLNNDWLVVLGRGDIFSKVQRLTHLFDKQLLATNAAVKVIDIRYSNGLAVEWQPQQKNDEQASFSAKVTMQEAEHKRG